ncbi:MAG: hypothetical protein A2X13_04350 [Bacteroidetes bacterium GWC2_33_15]|nr:MAG: hypothetical protein A2X10_11760 [Bacteroidetes bacterium GWA2_33_15]OFX49747.1 MAG: hypothetical protein A2X13_04350 [Bacteroidetes bacterium GWC2_33_15]OFX68376.1 MAG: hypothetical protein A2X14_08410 [Bacteroidetes bacterium GWD2_33_33]HAN18166.1 hypothetical protein [Bacteroidales bacterium]
MIGLMKKNAPNTKFLDVNQICGAQSIYIAMSNDSQLFCICTIARQENLVTSNNIVLTRRYKQDNFSIKIVLLWSINIKIY